MQMASQQAKPGGPQQPPPAAAGAQQQQQPGWNPMAMFQPFGQTVEQHIERGLDVVMGPADEEHLAAGRRKEKRRKKKRSEKEDKIPPVRVFAPCAGVGSSCPSAKCCPAPVGCYPPVHTVGRLPPARLPRRLTPSPRLCARVGQLRAGGCGEGVGAGGAHAP